METFFRRHFGRKGPRRASTVAVPTGKVRRRSQAGLPSASLAQRRRSSGAPLPALSCLGLPLHPSPRRRSSTTPPCLSPRFAVQMKHGGPARAIDAHLVGPSIPLASLIPTGEEGDGVPRTNSSRSESPEDDGVSAAAGAEQGRHERWAEERWLAMLPRLQPLQARLLSRGPRCLRRASSHRLPTEFMYGWAACGLPGRYRRLSQRRRSSDAPQPGLLPSGHLRLLAQHCVGAAGAGHPSAALPECLGPESTRHASPDGWSPRLLYVWRQLANVRCLGEGRLGADPGSVGKEGRGSTPLALAAISVLQCCLWPTEHLPLGPALLLVLSARHLGLAGVPFCQPGAGRRWQAWLWAGDAHFLQLAGSAAAFLHPSTSGRSLPAPKKQLLFFWIVVLVPKNAPGSEVP